MNPYDLIGIAASFVIQLGITMQLQFEAKCTAFILVFAVLIEYGIFKLFQNLIR